MAAGLPRRAPGLGVKKGKVQHTWKTVDKNAKYMSAIKIRLLMLS